VKCIADFIEVTEYWKSYEENILIKMSIGKNMAAKKKEEHWSYYFNSNRRIFVYFELFAKNITFSRLLCATFFSTKFSHYKK